MDTEETPTAYFVKWASSILPQRPEHGSRQAAFAEDSQRRHGRRAGEIIGRGRRDVFPQTPQQDRNHYKTGKKEEISFHLSTMTLCIFTANYRTSRPALIYCETLINAHRT
jgi:hypothetical protein